MGKGYTCWWNEEVKEAISRNKYAHKAMCGNSADEIRIRYKSMKQKAVSKAMIEKAEEMPSESKGFPNEMLRLLKGLN